jgi:hypothetical protein
LDYAWYCDSSGVLHIYNNGVDTAVSAGSYTTSTELAITYDASNFRFYRDRVLIYTAAVAGLILYADSSFYNPNAAVNSLHFGPGTSLEAVGTPGIEPNAATSPIGQAENAATFSVPQTSPVVTTNTDLLTLSITPATTGEIKLTASCTYEIPSAESGGSPSATHLQMILQESGIDVMTETKRIAVGAGTGPYDTPFLATMTRFVAVTGGLTYTARFRVRQVPGDATSPAPGVDASDRILRAEVNYR